MQLHGTFHGLKITNWNDSTTHFPERLCWQAKIIQSIKLFQRLLYCFFIFYFSLSNTLNDTVNHVWAILLTILDTHSIKSFSKTLLYFYYLLFLFMRKQEVCISVLHDLILLSNLFLASIMLVCIIVEVFFCSLMQSRW